MPQQAIPPPTRKARRPDPAAIGPRAAAGIIRRNHAAPRADLYALVRSGRIHPNRPGRHGIEGAAMKRRRLALLAELLRMVWHRKVFFLVPLLAFLLLGTVLLVIVESPVLLPFFYAIF